GLAGGADDVRAVGAVRIAPAPLIGEGDRLSPCPSARISRQHLALLGGTGDRRQNRVLRSCCCCGSRSSADKHEHKKSNQAFLHLEIPPPISRFQGGSDRGLPGDLQGKSSGFREEREDRVSSVCCSWHCRPSQAAASA